MKNITLPTLLPTLILTLLFCTCNRDISEGLGMSHLYIINGIDNRLIIQTNIIEVDSLLRKDVEIGETTYVCSGTDIGGWIVPSRIIKYTEILLLDEYGNILGQLPNTCDNDSFWVCTPNSTWEESFWYYTVR